MDKLNKKNIIIIIILALLIIGAIVALALFNSRGKETSEKDLEAVTTLFDEYIFGLTTHYPTEYRGSDVLYQEDETTYKDLHPNVILNVAADYAKDNNGDVSSINMQNQLTSMGFKPEDYIIALDGAMMVEGVEKIFGEELGHGSGANDNTYGFDYIYVPSLNVYLKVKNTKASFPTDGKHHVDYKTIEAITTKDNKVEMTIAIAYVHEIDDKVFYTSDKEKNNKVYEVKKSEAKEIKDEYLDKFQKYVVTFNYNEKGQNFTFESIKKAK